MDRPSPPSNEKSFHTPIMVERVLEGFKGLAIKTFYEATVGAGGHAQAILEAHPEIERYLGCDKDREALDRSRSTLAPWKKKVELIQGDFADLDLHLRERGIDQIDGFFLT